MDSDKYLLHQVHPAKLATDITAGIVSTALMWRRRRVRLVLVLAHVPPVIASAVVMRRDLSALGRTRRGRYVLAHMPPAAQAVRLSGQIVAWWAAYHHRVGGIAAGMALVIGGWSFGLLPWRDRTA